LHDQAGVDLSGEGVGSEREIYLKMVGLDEPILAVMAAVKVDPIHGAFGEGDFASYVAGQRNAHNERMLEPFADGGEGAMEVAAG